MTQESPENKQRGQLAKALINKSERLFNSTERKNAEVQWRLISEFMLPNQSGLFLSTSNADRQSLNGISTPGAKKTERLYDSTAVQANRDLASAMHAALTNPAAQWLKMVYSDPTAANDPQAVAWLEEVNRIMNQQVNESNYDMEASKAYPMYTALGNGPILIDADYDDQNNFLGLKFESIHLANIVWTENSRSTVDGFFRQINYTAEQAIELFGEEAGEEIKRMVNKDPNREYLFLQAVYKRPKSEVRLNELGLAPGKNRPYASIFINVSEAKVVLETGYYEFPLAVARYDVMPGERYGRGPGHVALPDVRSLNALRKEELAGAALANRPVLEVIQRDILGTLDLRPAGMISVRQKGAVSPLNIGLQPGITTAEREQLREQIKRIFFLDKLLLPPRNEIGEMTAQEVRQRAEEIQRVFGPTLGRLNHEYLGVQANRIYQVLFRAGAFPELPPRLVEEGVNVEIKFVNQFAKSQQLEDVSNILGFANELGLLAQLSPEALDYFDADGAIKHIARVRGIPDSVLANDDEVAQIRQQRAQQAQQMQALQAATQVADITSKSK